MINLTSNQTTLLLANVANTVGNEPASAVNEGHYLIYLFEKFLYLIYTLVFLCGIVGNAIVVLVLIASICCMRKRQFSLDLDNECQCGHKVNNKSTNKLIGHKNSDASATRATRTSSSTANTTAKNYNGLKLNKLNGGNHSFNMKETSSLKANHNNTSNSELCVSSSIDLISQGKSQQARTKLKIKLSDSYEAYNQKRVRNNLLREKLAVTNFYLLNLAISDFFYIMFIPILLLTMTYEKWIFGPIICKLYLTLAYLCQFSSVFILVILSVDRYLSVMYPGKVNSFRSIPKAIFIIALSWLLSAFFTMPILAYTKLQNDESQTATCIIEWPEAWHSSFNETHSSKMIIDRYLPPLYAFTIYSLSFNYLIPVSLIVVLYTLILKRLFQLKNANSSRIKKRSHRRITKMVLAIITCYILSWSPYWFVQFFHYIYQHLLERNNSIVLTIVSHVAQVIAYFSSALNPFIYSFMSEGFKAHLLHFKTDKLGPCCHTQATSRRKKLSNNKSNNYTYASDEENAAYDYDDDDDLNEVFYSSKKEIDTEI